MRHLAVVFVWMAAASAAAAQGLPSEPVALGGGRVVLGGDVSVAVAPEDRGFFNYSDYEQTTLRQLRAGLAGLVRISERVSLHGEVRSENFQHVAPFALYVRVRPFPRRRLEIQAGRIPPTFGSFSRRTYSDDNPLPGHPLAYQYLTSLRADAIPADADELLRMRGRGWRASYTIGSEEARSGVPLVSGFTWDTGVQVASAWDAVTVAAAVTTGTASNPRVADDNAGKQISARISVRPLTGLVLGASFARGDFLARSVRAALPAAQDEAYTQEARGADVEYSRDHWIVRAETVLSTWRIPFAAAGAAPVRLHALATSVEARYTFMPGAYAAVRAEHLGFNRITGTARRDEWEAPVSRIEVGGGYYLRRNVVARASLQLNERDGGRVRRSRLVAGQMLYWF